MNIQQHKKNHLCAILSRQINSLSVCHFSCITTSLKMRIVLHLSPPPPPITMLGKRTNFPSGTAPSTRPEAQHCNGGAGGCENILLKTSYDSFVANCRPVLVTFFIFKKTEQKSIVVYFFNLLTKHAFPHGKTTRSTVLHINIARQCPITAKFLKTKGHQSWSYLISRDKYICRSTRQ